MLPAVAAKEMRVKVTGASLVIFSAFLWGTSFPMIKVTLGGAQDEVSFSFVLSITRLALAAILGLSLLAVIKRANWRIFREPVVWFLGALNAVSFGAQHLGIVYTTASKTALLVNFSVVFVAILSFLFFQELFNKRKVIGVVLGISGVVAVATRLDPGFLMHGELFGDMLVFLAGFLWSLYILYTKRALERGLDYIGLSVAVLATTTIFLLIPLPFVNTSQAVSAPGWGGIIYLGIVSTLLPLILWTKALKQLSATVSSVLLLLEVFFAVVLSVVFIGEEFLFAYLLGGSLILAGGLLATTTETKNTGPIME